jgi:conjugative transfer signal peptidase TraF
MRDRFAHLRMTGELNRPPRFGRRRRRWRSLVIVGAIGIAALGISLLAHPVPRLVFNGSASAPIGFYSVRSTEALSPGELVLARLPERARRLAADRGYLSADVPVVKHAAAFGGDLVCADSGIVVINDRVAARTLLMDREGRPLPAWHGCRVLAEGEVFLLNEGVRGSFDGRYFGPIERSAIIGRLVPLWTW